MHWTVRGTDFFVAAAGVILCATPAGAAEKRSYAIPAGSLSDVILRFGEQSGLSIAIVDGSVGRQRSPGLRGRYTPVQALRRLLRGTGATFAFVNPRAVRIHAAPPPRPSKPARPRPVATVPPPEEIIVTASKQSIPIARYAGSVSVIDLDSDLSARTASQGTSAIIARLPMLASTSLGPGRDKLFIRGVADSSFNGPSQATVGQYLGDVRLTYNAPDPDLNLYDMARVEVLAGPQGTLYGTGSLGGIIRLVPNMPDPAGWSGSGSVGVAATQGGATSTDAAAMLNVPVIEERLAIRAVGYRAVNGGYIDNPLLGRKNINRTLISGGRLGVRFLPGDAWTIDVGGVLQNIDSRDGQYTLRGEPDLTRRTAIAQPFDNDYRLADLGIAKQWPGVKLVSSTAFRSADDRDRIRRFTLAGFGQSASVRRNDRRLAPVP